MHEHGLLLVVGARDMRVDVEIGGDSGKLVDIDCDGIGVDMVETPAEVGVDNSAEGDAEDNSTETDAVARSYSNR